MNSSRQDNESSSFPKSNELINLTGVNDKYNNERRLLKHSFIKNNQYKQNTYVQDLEYTIKINKEILSEILVENKSSKVVEKLNAENCLLHTRISNLIKSQEQIEARLLISEQIIKELKVREKEACMEFAEKERHLLDQLNRKEHMLQVYEKERIKLEVLLAEYAKKNPEIRKALKVVKAEFDITPKTITNVVSENNSLSKKLAEAENKINDLESKLTQLTAENINQAKVIEELRDTLTKSRIRDLHHTQKSVERVLSDIESIRVEEKEKLKVENEELRKNNKKLKVEMRRLFMVNEKLNKVVEAASIKFDKIQKKRFNKTSIIKSGEIFVKKELEKHKLFNTEESNLGIKLPM